MTGQPEIPGSWLGLCPKSPAMHTTALALIGQPETVHPAPPGNSGPAGRPGRIRDGIGIATGSIRTLFRERRLLWFSLLAGLVILFLFVAEGWSLAHFAEIPLPYSIWIPAGNSVLIVFNMQLFLIEAVCLSCFTGLLAALLLHRDAGSAGTPVTIRKALAGVSAHAGSLAALSVLMAFFATVVFEIISQDPFIGRLIFTLDMALFHLPYAYYVPGWISSIYYFSFKIMAINIVLFLPALYVVPAIVLEGKKLPLALAGSRTLMKKTWRELLGCFFVLVAISLVVFAAGLLIGQSPLLLNHDYDFFLQMSRGQGLMTAACYGFLLTCVLLMATGFTAAGVAIADLCHAGKSTGIPGEPEGSLEKAGTAS